MLTEAFQTLKNNLELNPTFDGRIQQHHNAVRGVVENNRPGVTTKLIGSLQRQTRIQPGPGQTFDIDILVVFGNFYSWLPPGAAGGVSVQQAMEQLHEAVDDSDRYGEMDPQQDQPTVSFTYEDGTKVELVPAYLDLIGQSANGVTHTPKGRAYWIPRNGQWVLADYDHEADHITQMNAAAGNYLVPIIKMLKAAKRLHFPAVGSFHLEIVAAHLIPSIVAVRRANRLPISYPILIGDFFNYAGEHFQAPKKIPESHSDHCSLDPLARDQVLRQIEAVKQHCIAIDGLGSDSQKMQAWRNLFGDPFPARV